MNVLATSNAGSYSGILLIVVMIVAMYFLMIRPQRKQQQKHQSVLSQLQRGDHVVTIGRLHGVVDEINRDAGTVTLDCDGIYLVFDLNAIASVKQKAAVSETVTNTQSDSQPVESDETGSETPASETPASDEKTD